VHKLRKYGKNLSPPESFYTTNGDITARHVEEDFTMNNLTPLNVYSQSDEEVGRLMSNFAHTPFTLDGVTYASVEGFYVALKFLDDAERTKVAALYGAVVKRMGRKSKLTRTYYNGEWFELSSETHHALIKRAIRAKLDAHPEIAKAFAATRPRPITHDTGRPDHPGARFPAEVFCRVLTELREELATERS
jgi:predicted NAD-dependent protein-ADP-ribosyltransferase YbiA (DUF1768 family)